MQKVWIYENLPRKVKENSKNSMKSKSLDDDYFIKNSILCFLHYYPNHKWTPIYEELAKRDTFTKATTRTQRTPRTRKSNAKKTDS